MAPVEIPSALTPPPEDENNTVVSNVTTHEPCHRPSLSTHTRRFNTYSWENFCAELKPGLGCIIFLILGLFLLFIFLPDHHNKVYTKGR